MPRKNVILGGYAMPREDLVAWSAREAETNPVYKRCLEKMDGLVILAVDHYLRKQKLDHLIKQSYLPKAGHGACSLTRCNNTNVIFYRRSATKQTMAKFRPDDWKRFRETVTDQAVKARLQAAFHMALPEWSVVVHGPRAMLYDATPNMFEEDGDRLIELLQNGPQGPCDVA
ncbi:hypothetical protein FRC06_006994 [Ceratobasidium sp. 370]|nr:hypothetical protein FRC06_006994 [Ceratobasidium sp. 370]